MTSSAECQMERRERRACSFLHRPWTWKIDWFTAPPSIAKEPPFQLHWPPLQLSSVTLAHHVSPFTTIGVAPFWFIRQIHTFLSPSPLDLHRWYSFFYYKNPQIQLQDLNAVSTKPTSPNTSLIRDLGEVPLWRL